MGNEGEFLESAGYTKLKDDALESQTANRHAQGDENAPAGTVYAPGTFHSVHCLSRSQVIFCAGWLANVSYSFAVSSMFASLSAEKYDDAWGYWYGASSWLMNFPMSIVFAYQASEKFRHMCNNRLAAVASATGLTLALATTLAGIAIACDAVSDSNNSLVRHSGWFGVTLFSFNTFSTRWVAATALIEGLLSQSMRKKKRQQTRFQKALATLLSDSKRLPNNFFIKNRVDLGLESQVLSVYKSIPRSPASEKCLSRIGSHYGGKWLVSALLTYFALQTLPMWLDKAEQGGVALAKQIGLKPNSFSSFDALGMASSVLFYLLSAWTFVDTVVNFYSYVQYNNPRTSRYSSTGKTAVLMGSLLALFTLAWASGEGMKNEGLKSLSETGFSNNTQAYIDSDFGQVVTPKLWQSTWFVLFNLISGVVVNGRSALKFISQMGELCRRPSAVKRLVNSINQDYGEDEDLNCQLVGAPMAREYFAQIIEEKHKLLHGLNQSPVNRRYEEQDRSGEYEEVKQSIGHDV